MNPRERILSAFEHEEPDRLSLEVWRAPAFEAKVHQHLSEAEITKFTPNLWLGIQSIGPGISDEFRKRGIVSYPFVHYGTGIPIDERTVEDEWGIRRRLTSASTESRIIYHPLKDASADSLDDYPFPDPYAPGRFNVSKDEVEKWKENYVVAGGFGVDTGWLHAWQMRGFTQFTVDLYANPEFVEKLLDKLFEYYQGILKQEVDLGIEMVRMLPDDVATQTGMIISPKMWRKYLKPRYKKLIASVKPKVKYVLFHSDGNYEPIMPDLIEVGVNIFNPIQPDCMDIEQLKNQYGDKVTLWGGLSVQDTLPHGTVDDVKAEVKRTIEICAPGGGFVLGTSNNITQDTPVENFLAIYEVAKKYGRYPISTS